MSATMVFSCYQQVCSHLAPAENYYTHDYPDEDLDWDDEFDRNACRFATQNDSDNEEWDERDFSDEVWERVQGMNPSARPG